MPEEFSHKHIHSVIWLIVIILAAIIIAGFLMVRLTDNASVVPPIIPDTMVEPAKVEPAKKDVSSNNQQPGSVVTSGSNGTKPRVNAGEAYMNAPAIVQTGDQISVEVLMDTDRKNINVAKISLTYDGKLLRYEGFDETDTVLPMKFRDEAMAGKVIISRGVPGDADPNDNDDGYTGSAGNFGRFQFVALKSGSSQIDFDAQDTRFYLDDGQGSVIYPKLKSINIIVN